MEEVDKDPEEAPEAQTGLMEEQSQSEEEENEELVTPQRIINMQRDLSTLVTNIQTAADAKELMRRKELEEAHRLRFERLENDIKSSREKFDEISRGWLTPKQKASLQELLEARNKQQELCAASKDDLKKVINDLQQEMKAGNDCYVKDLRKLSEELDLMMERMEDQIKTLTKAYREELAQTEVVYQQECEALLAKDMAEWEQCLKELWDKELERLAEREKTVKEYEEKRHNEMFETAHKLGLMQVEKSIKSQEEERERQTKRVNPFVSEIQHSEAKAQLKKEKRQWAYIKARFRSLQRKISDQTTKFKIQEQQLRKKILNLSADCKCNSQKYERIQKKIKHFAAADVKKFEQMWLMIEAEVKELVERALVVDSLICRQHLGVPWERPPMSFMEHSGPVQPQKHKVSQLFQTEQALQYSQGMMDEGPKPETDDESADEEKHKEGELSMETMKTVIKLLCDESGFLMEDKLTILALQEKEEQTIVKLDSLLSSFGIEEEDVPQLAHFLLKYKHQQREQTEDVCSESGEISDEAGETSSAAPLTSELIDPNHVVPALKSFIEQLMKSREKKSVHQHPALGYVMARDASEDEAYWESMGNIISEDKLKVWDTAESLLKQYEAVLTEISELVPQTESLEQQNAELRMLLQQTLHSKVTIEMAMP